MNLFLGDFHFSNGTVCVFDPLEELGIDLRVNMTRLEIIDTPGNSQLFRVNDFIGCRLTGLWDVTIKEMEMEIQTCKLMSQRVIPVPV